MKKCVFGLVLGMIALFMTIIPNFISQGAELGNGSQGNVVESVSFTANGNPVTDGTTVSLTDEFQVEYKLVSPLYMNYAEDDKEEGHVYLQKGDVIELPEIMSTVFDLSKIGEFELDLDDGTNFGTVNVSSEGKVKLTVNYEDNSNVEDVVVGFKLGLNSSEIGEQEQYTFQIPGLEPKTVTVHFEEKEPVEPEPSKPKDVVSIEKDGGVFDAEGKATWEITFGNNGVELDSVILYDYLSSDEKAGFELIPESIVIKDESGNTLVPEVDYKIIYEKGVTPLSEGRRNYTWKVEFGKIVGDKTYTVSYDTKVDNFEDFLMDIYRIPTNSAWVEYKYRPEGSETRRFIRGVVAEKKAKGPNVSGKSAIDKYLASSEPATHQFTWHVILNKNRRNITDVTMFEKIGEGQKLVSISDISFRDNKAKVWTERLEPTLQEDGSYKFEFGDRLNGALAQFDVVTELTEEEIPVWEANSNKKYDNSIILNSAQQGTLSFTAEGRCKWKDTVLEKTGKVDKETKNVNYTVAINGGKQLLPEKLEIKDTLGENLTFVQDSIKLYVGAVDAESKKVVATDVLEQGYTTEFTKEGNNEVLVITLPEKKDNNNAYVLTYTARPTAIIEAGDYTNKIQLLGYGYQSSSRDESEISFENFGGGRITDPIIRIKPTPTPEVEPTPVPEETPSNGGTSSKDNSSSGGSGSSSSSSNNSSSDVVGYGETIISIESPLTPTSGNLADENVNAGSSLAKTGGFIGTVAGYLAGLILLLTGCYLVLGKTKKNK